MLFNAGDLGGRLLAGVGSQKHKSLPAAVLLSYAAARVLLVVGLLLCHVVTPHPWRLPLAYRCLLNCVGTHVCVAYSMGKYIV